MPYCNNRLFRLPRRVRSGILHIEINRRKYADLLLRQVPAPEYEQFMRQLRQTYRARQRVIYGVTTGCRWATWSSWGGCCASADCPGAADCGDVRDGIHLTGARAVDFLTNSGILLPWCRHSWEDAVALVCSSWPCRVGKTCSMCWAPRVPSSTRIRPTRLHCWARGLRYDKRAIQQNADGVPF